MFYEREQTLSEDYHNELRACRLCHVCRTIEFADLRLPTFDQLRTFSETALFSDSLEVHFNSDAVFPPRLPLGTLTRVKASSVDCPLCALIWKILVRNNYGEEPELVCSANERDNECFIWGWPYGNFTDPTSDRSELRARHEALHENMLEKSSLHNMVRRLSLRVGAPAVDGEDDEEPFWWDIWYCLQSCAVDGCSLSPSEAWKAAGPTRALAFGGRQRPLRIDMQWLRQWIDICDHEHGAACHTSRDEQDLPVRSTHSQSPTPDHLSLPEIRLINVNKKCIEAFHANNIPAYAALSYVWGKDQRLKLLKGNQSMLMHPNALVNNPPAVTILDAIDVVVQLALPHLSHLWVDALCIVQDSDEDKQNQIGRMGRIYTEASLTIVAAAGEDADAGLPGVRVDTRAVKQTIVPVMVKPGVRTIIKGGFVLHENGMALTDTLSPLPDDGHDFWTTSVYSTRGWCMQERVLSRRRLIFTAEQVFWQCSERTFCEDTHFESSLAQFAPYYRGAQGDKQSLQQALEATDDTVPDRMHTDAFKECLSVYSSLANSFWELDFTHEGDVLDAFSGITQALTARTGESFLFGMPTSRFGQALLWADEGYEGPQYDSSVRRRMAQTTHAITSLRQRLRLPSWSWLAWTGGLSVFVSPDVQSIRVPELVCFVHTPGAKNIVSVDTHFTAEAIKYAKLPGGREDLRSHWEKSVDRTVTLEHIKEHLPATADALHRTPEGTLLFFWTSMSSFRVKLPHKHLQILATKPSLDPSSTTWKYNKEPPINGVDQYWVGGLHSKGDAKWNSTLNRLHKEEDICDFIVVGRGDMGHVPQLLVMSIAFQGEVAMRMGLGTINEDAWAASEPQWKLIALG